MVEFVLESIDLGIVLEVEIITVVDWDVLLDVAC